MVDDRTLDYMEGMGCKVLYISGEEGFPSCRSHTSLSPRSERGKVG